MQSGTIARLLLDKGFGFIRDERGTEHFFHVARFVKRSLSYCGTANALSLRPKNRRKDRVPVMCAWSTNEPEHRGSGDSVRRVGRDGINATTAR